MLPLDAVLGALGDWLGEAGERCALVVVGGASLSLLGLVRRTTQDVDVIARARRLDEGGVNLFPPEPLPEVLLEAVARVARDFSLPPDWLNTDVALQWRVGLPPGIERDLSWKTYGGLSVGLVGRQTQIYLKLFAAVDNGPKSVHFQDLITLNPSLDEVAEAAEWVRTQDASLVFGGLLDEVVDRLASPPR